MSKKDSHRQRGLLCGSSSPLWYFQPVRVVDQYAVCRQSWSQHLQLRRTRCILYQLPPLLLISRHQKFTLNKTITVTMTVYNNLHQNKTRSEIVWNYIVNSFTNVNRSTTLPTPTSGCMLMNSWMLLVLSVTYHIYYLLTSFIDVKNLGEKTKNVEKLTFQNVIKTFITCQCKIT